MKFGSEIKIGNRIVGKGHAPFIIAEISGNHLNDKNIALVLVQKSIDAGASAIKLQTYKPETMTLDCDAEDFVVKGSNENWEGETLFNLYEKAFTPWEWHKDIFELCKKHDVPCFSSPFDKTAVDLLEELGAPAYKIASFECVDIPLIKYVASKKKPVIMSTGMATMEEIATAVEAFESAGGENLILLKCTSSYPAPPENSNLNVIPHLSKLFDCQVGLSDHTLGTTAPLVAISLGATVVEKHVTLSRTNGAVDSSFSMEPEEFKGMMAESVNAWKSLGKIQYGPSEVELENRKYRRSLYVSQDVKAGDKVTAENVRAVRPGKGLAPKYLEVVQGMTFAQDVKLGTALSWELFK